MAVSQHPSKLGVCGVVLEHRDSCDHSYSKHSISFPIYLGIQPEQEQGKDGLSAALRGTYSTGLYTDIELPGLKECPHDENHLLNDSVVGR